MFPQYSAMERRKGGLAYVCQPTHSSVSMISFVRRRPVSRLHGTLELTGIHQLLKVLQKEGRLCRMVRLGFSYHRKVVLRIETDEVSEFGPVTRFSVLRGLGIGELGSRLVV
ncbi:hypothetical protein R1flu_003656 [Riccia fluitans]|uniref:Uncharacterized protein n=1 Tax=Riccia fluitans TaxID=41844 RepID=A0ABD1Y9L1_9MARC